MTREVVTDFIVNNWLTLFLTALSAVLSWIIFIKQKHERRLVFYLLKPRAVIVSSEHLESAPIIITDQKGEQVKSDLTAVWLYFWNKGKQPIKSTDIIEQLTISVDNSTAEFLGAKLVTTSNKYSAIQLVPNTPFPSKSFSIELAILDHLDGGVIQLFLKGKKDADIQISGKIEGYSYKATNRVIGLMPESRGILVYYVTLLYNFILIVIIGALLELIGISLSWDIKLGLLVTSFIISPFYVQWLPLPNIYPIPKSLR